MSNIIEELRSNKRQLTENFDANRDRPRQSATADRNNNDEMGPAATPSRFHGSSSSGLSVRSFPALTPTSSAAARRRGQSRSKRRRMQSEAGCYDHSGALDLTCVKRAARTSSSVDRRLSASSVLSGAFSDSVPMDLSLSSRISGTPVDDACSSIQTTSSTFCPAANCISFWSVRDVANFVSVVPGCTLYAEIFNRMSVDGSTLATISVDRMLSELGMRRDAAETLRFTVDRILASPLS